MLRNGGDDLGKLADRGGDNRFRLQFILKNIKRQKFLLINFDVWGFFLAERLRDPIHGLISFTGEIDKVAWSLIDTAEFQRLRRIKQLGFSEQVFPSATHSRFAHSIGVYNNARRLLAAVKSQIGEDEYNEKRARCVLLAALIHDVGHGPFSHAFETAREAIARDKGKSAIEKHEIFSGRIILNRKGDIFTVLSDVDPELPKQISELLSEDDPTDIYHSIVSSSFDADRLDYLVRDRYMTGTKAGSIDQDWLLDNLRITEIQVGQDDDPQPRHMSTFAFHLKGRQAAEDFLLARYRLFYQVYLHKTTRGFEVLLTRILRIIGDDNVPAGDLNLLEQNPLLKFLRGEESVENYLALDDNLVWGSLGQISRSKHDYASNLANKLIRREHLHAYDITEEFGKTDEIALHNAERRLDKFAKNRLGDTIFKDDPKINLYATVDGESEKSHKMVRVISGSGEPQQITEFPDTVISGTLINQKRLIRYYFLTEAEKLEAEKAVRGRL